MKYIYKNHTCLEAVSPFHSQQWSEEKHFYLRWGNNSISDLWETVRRLLLIQRPGSNLWADLMGSIEDKAALLHILSVFPW